MKNKLKSGRIFDDKEFQLHEDAYVPVIIGANYNGLFQINDTFSAYFVGQIILNCKVIGVLENNTNFEFADNKYNLDNYLIIPLLNIDSNKINDSLDLFSKILLTIKSEGYIYYDSIDDKNEQINEIKKYQITQALNMILRNMTISNS